MNKSGYEIVKNEKGLVGLRDPEGREIEPCVYDNILDYDDDGYIRLVKDGFYRTINLKGKEGIGFACGVTHLGVFHGGTARARKGDRWGLIDPNGEEITPFDFQQMNAHYNNGYKAVDVHGVVGWLSEEGEFTPFKKQPKTAHRPPYQIVRPYHSDVAPAYKWDGGWVFVDRNLRQINHYEYVSMDPVLRHGIYEVRSEKGYGAASYDGTPIIDEWYSLPIHFENGFAECKKPYVVDEEGIISPSIYVYGILKEDGTYLFPPIFDKLHWNDFKTKDCWYAEDDDFSYLLYPDGLKRVYEKTIVNRNSAWPFIPNILKDNYIRDSLLVNRYEPKFVASMKFKAFEKSRFYNSLGLWLGCYYSDYLDSWRIPLKFYYRDTDAPIDVDKMYRKGMVLRADGIMEATQKLMRPVHKVRFLIASCLMQSKVENPQTEFERMASKLPYKESFTHYNACFLVYDIQKHDNRTQILLIEIPFCAAKFALEHKLPLTGRQAYSEDDYTLESAAFADFHDKCCKDIHGNSLSPYWEKVMYQPIGYDKDMKLLPIEKQTSCEGLTDEQRRIFDSYYGRRTDDDDRFWEYEHFEIPQPYSIDVVVGDITKLQVDGIVNAANNTLRGGGGVDGAIHLAAGEELLEACRRHKGCRTGQSKVTSAFHLPCEKVIHTVGPIWCDGQHGENRLLASCYSSALHVARKHKLKSIAFPCISTGVYGFPKERAAAIAMTTLLKELKKLYFTGRVIICCFTNDDAKVYKKWIEENGEEVDIYDCPLEYEE